MSLSVSIKKRPQMYKPKREFDFQTRALARRAGRLMRNAIREQIPSGNGKVGVWPSCMATGALQSAVVAQEPVKRNGVWHQRVGIKRNRRSAKYARIHEKGGTITPVSTKKLVFVIPAACVKSMPQKQKKHISKGGRGNIVIPQKDGSLLVLAKQVKIRKKRYFEKGWAEGRRRIQSTLSLNVKGHAFH